MVKNPPASLRDAGYAGSIPGSVRSPGGGNDNPLQYSCLDNSMDRELWLANIHGAAKSRTQLSNWADSHNCWSPWTSLETKTNPTDVSRWGNKKSLHLLSIRLHARFFAKQFMPISPKIVLSPLRTVTAGTQRSLVKALSSSTRESPRVYLKV